MISQIFDSIVAMRVSETVFACHSKACAPPPAGTGGSSPKGSGSLSPSTAAAIRVAFRGANPAITSVKRTGGKVTTSHKGRNWEIRVHDRANKQTHHAKGRAKDPEAALNRLVDEYLKHT